MIYICCPWVNCRRLWCSFSLLHLYFRYIPTFTGLLILWKNPTDTFEEFLSRDTAWLHWTPYSWNKYTSRTILGQIRIKSPGHLLVHIPVFHAGWCRANKNSTNFIIIVIESSCLGIDILLFCTTQNTDDWKAVLHVNKTDIYVIQLLWLVAESTMYLSLIGTCWISWAIWRIMQPLL